MPGLILAVALIALGAPAASARTDPRYTLANGCYALRSQSTGLFVAKHADGGYRASAASPGEAEPFRMKATRLGSYMLYGRQGDFLAEGSRDPADILAGATPDRVEPASAPSESADWRVDDSGPGAFRIVLTARGKTLAVVGGRRELALTDGSGSAASFSFHRTQGCAAFPEVQVNATGAPPRGSTAFAEVRGLLDAHIHGMAFEFLGGRVHCGRPWSPYGVTVALVDCPDHFGNGAGAVLENTISYGNPARTHDPVGWPTFRDWPAAKSLTHEQTYYRWLERAWRGGLRIWVNLLVDNHALCELYPLKKNSCNEMDGVRLQAHDLYALQDYIDAQSGGPGKGWFRIVKDPFQARRVINRGKLAVVMGIEVSKLFDCGEVNHQPQCDKATIDRELNEVYGLGVRDMELVNKFDNALTGVTGDAGQTGVVVNQGNRYETNHYWEMQHCDGARGAADKTQSTTAPGDGRDQLAGGLFQLLLPPGATPVYPQPPHCNDRGLTDLGEYVVRRMMAKRMIIDPDHMSVRGRNHLLSILESRNYSGVVSSHSWSTPDAYPRIYRLGGVITPYAGDSTTFVQKWRQIRPMRDRHYYFGFGYGADMNGFGAQGNPRGRNVPNPVHYPFKSFDGKVTLGHQVSGQRVYDINVDGVAHYGLYPDWIEDLRVLAGPQIIRDMARGPEAYLEMWERAVGAARRFCQPARSDVSPRAIGHVRLRDSWEQVLRRAGQPLHRPGRVFRYCVNRRGPRPRGRLAAVMTRTGRVALILTTAPGHRVGHVGRGTRAPRGGRRIGGLVVRRAGGGARYVYGVRGGRVTFVALGTRAATSGRALRANLRLAGAR